jgi:hypothetical protein
LRLLCLKPFGNERFRLSRWFELVDLFSRVSMLPHLLREQGVPTLRQSPRSLPIVIAGCLMMVLDGGYNLRDFCSREESDNHYRESS